MNSFLFGRRTFTLSVHPFRGTDLSMVAWQSKSFTDIQTSLSFHAEASGEI